MPEVEPAVQRPIGSSALFPRVGRSEVVGVARKARASSTSDALWVETGGFTPLIALGAEDSVVGLGQHQGLTALVTGRLSHGRSMPEALARSGSYGAHTSRDTMANPAA